MCVCVVLPLRVQGMWQRGFGGPLGGLRVLNLSGNAALGAFRGNLSDRISRRNIAIAPFCLHPFEGRLLWSGLLVEVSFVSVLGVFGCV